MVLKTHLALKLNGKFSNVSSYMSIAAKKIYFLYGHWKKPLTNK